MAALNARIARLAMALGVDLNDRAAVDAVMVKQLTLPGEVERRRASADGPSKRVASALLALLVAHNARRDQPRSVW